MSVLRFFRTVRFLQVRQVTARVLMALPARVIPQNSKKYVACEPVSKWTSFKINIDRINNNGEFVFLNRRKKVEFPIDWEPDSEVLLWKYNLHYFDDLQAVNAEKRSALHQRMLCDWVTANQNIRELGWSPYPTSLRIVNVLKTWLDGTPIPDPIMQNVALQAEVLSKRLETHLLANHYFANLKALLFAGLVFGNYSWKSLALRELVEQLREQILPDGSHCELSPMYHGAVLVDVLDIINVVRAYEEAESATLLNMLEEAAVDQLVFLDLMTHDNGDLAGFNDCASGVIPPVDRIYQYARQLKIPESNSEKGGSLQVNDLRHSGYVVCKRGRDKLIFDAGPIGYASNPGHAHADTLSFELSINSKQAIVNCGTSEYEKTERRYWERGTQSHSVVQIGEQDSSEVWSTFRVGRRASVLERQVTIASDSALLSAKHDGYERLGKRREVARSLKFGKGYLIIQDSVSGMKSGWVSRFHFHHEASLEITDHKLVIDRDAFSLKVNLAGMRYQIKNYEHGIEFGMLRSAKALEIFAESTRVELKFEWETNLDLTL